PGALSIRSWRNDRSRRPEGVRISLGIVGPSCSPRELKRSLPGYKRSDSTKLAQKEVRAVNSYFVGGRVLKTVRASGFLGDQSSGGKATRQKVGLGAENSKPISALPLRTGPRKTTWHSCSSSVHLCCKRTVLPLMTRAASSTNAP